MREEKEAIEGGRLRSLAVPSQHGASLLYLGRARATHDRVLLLECGGGEYARLMFETAQKPLLHAPRAEVKKCKYTKVTRTKPK